MSFFPHFRIYKKNKHPALILGYAKIEKEEMGLFLERHLILQT